MATKFLVASGVSVLDVTRFDALPEDVRLLAARVLGQSADADALAEAYRDGYKDGAADCDIERPAPPDLKEVKEILARRAKARTGL